MNRNRGAGKQSVPSRGVWGHASIISLVTPKMASKRKRNVLSLEKKLILLHKSSRVRHRGLLRSFLTRLSRRWAIFGKIEKRLRGMCPPVLIPRSLRSALSCETCISTSLTKLLVKNWMTTAGRKRSNSLTQTEITSFFRPITS